RTTINHPLHHQLHKQKLHKQNSTRNLHKQKLRKTPQAKLAILYKQTSQTSQYSTSHTLQNSTSNFLCAPLAVRTRIYDNTNHPTTDQFISTPKSNLYDHAPHICSYSPMDANVHLL